MTRPGTAVPPLPGPGSSPAMERYLAEVTARRQSRLLVAAAASLARFMLAGRSARRCLASRASLA
jgi:hypothetical protein